MIEGARRVGKSYIAREFARNEYDSFILIDFSKAPQRVRGWFDEYLEDVDTLYVTAAALDDRLVRLYTRTGDAQKLYLSVHTVNTHRQRIYSKMDVKNVSDMLRRTTESGII